MNGSIVLARGCQCAPPSDTCFHGPTRVHRPTPNDISIGSAVFAQLSAAGPHTLQWAAHFPLRLAHYSHRGIRTPAQYMAPWAHPSPQPKRHLDRFSCFCRADDRDRPTDRQTDHATPRITTGRIYIRNTAMRSNKPGVTTGSPPVIGVEDTEDSKPKDGRR